VITVVCEGGTARFELKECRWRWMTQTDGPWQEETFGPMERDDWFIRQEQAFLDALEGKAPVLCTLEEGLHTLKVNLAALASADEGGGMRVVG
jgi:predicted dehydrogenase